MLLIPQRLFGLPSIERILFDGQSCILRKYLTEPTLNRQSFIATTVLSFVQKGVQQISNYDGDTVKVRAGEFVVLPKGIYTISDLFPDEEAFETILFFIHDHLIDRYLATHHRLPDNPVQTSIGYRSTAYPSLRIYVKALLQLYSNPTLDHASLLEVKLLELLHLLRESDESQRFLPYLFSTRVGKKRNLRTFMEDNFDKPLKVEDYAYMTGRSISSFRRDFKQFFDTTPQQWLKDKRLKRAADLLLQDEHSITTTAFEVGYESLSYFIKAFKQKYDITPKQFVQQERGRKMAE